MKQLSHSPADLSYKLVNFGVDTLVLNVRYADMQGKRADRVLPDDIIVALDAWKAVAKERKKPIPLSAFAFDDAALMIYPHGAGQGQWSWLLNCPAFKLYIGRGRLNGTVAQVRFSSPYLWSHEWPDDHTQDLWKSIHAVKGFLTRLFAPESGRLHFQPSELHLCADIAGWDVSRCDWQQTFLSRARTRVDRAEQLDVSGGAPVAVYDGRRLATLEFGSHRSPLSCTIYNKTLELRKSLKLWFEDIWKQHGWDGSSEVWRVEYRWRRESLHDIAQEGVFHGIEDISDLDPSLLSSLWSYAAGHTQGGGDGWPDGWLRYAVPSGDSNIARWPVHPAWQVVQSAFATETEEAVNVETNETFEVPTSSLAALIRKRHREVNVKRMAQQVGGCLSTLTAWIEGSADDLPAILTYLVDHLPAYVLSDLAGIVPVDRLEAEFAKHFAAQVSEKRALYGIPVNNENEVQHG